MLSVAERSAMRLDGELVALGDGALHIDRVVGPFDRLGVLDIALHPAHIVSGLAAAWVHGAAPLPPTIDLAVLRHRRADAPPGCRLHIRRVRLDECVSSAGRTVTGRARTAIDLLADEPFCADARRAIPLLVDDEEALARAIPGAGRAHVGRMLARLASLGRRDGSRR